MTSTSTRARKQTPSPKSEASKPLDPSTLREMAREAMEKDLPPLTKEQLKKFKMR